MTYHGISQMRFSFGLALVCSCLARAQTTGVGPAETTTKEEPATFRTRVNLVVVPVVVRDRQGRAVGTLKQEDFQLLDKGKAQVISRFSVEHAAGKTPAGAKRPGSAAADVAAPERYVAYLFDDIHLRFEDLVRVRDAAWAHIRDQLSQTDRAAIYTTSGQNNQEFTDDKDALQRAIGLLRPRPISRRSTQECPDVSYYMADLIVNKNDPTALRAGLSETMACNNLTAEGARTAESILRSAATQALMEGSHETRIALGTLREVARRMAETPGQRVIVLASPGFLTPGEQTEKTEVIDRAIKANVTINSLDARGLYVDGSNDITRRVFDSEANRIKGQLEREANRTNGDVLAEIAFGTGGTFFENSNDLKAGYRKLADQPEHLYLLAFSPQNLKLDGSFHPLRVVLRSSERLTAIARKGYYAPRQLNDPLETAKEEIREALFSREELHELPVEMQNQFYKPSDQTARVTIVTRVDLKGLKYHLEDTRHRNTLTIVCGIFDHNGNYLTGNQKTLEMRLKDETVSRPTSGINIRSTFDVKPGGYLIRLVVRDAEEQRITALNGAVEVP